MNDEILETPKEYPKCWVFDVNRRVYKKDENGRSEGGPIWREHWRPITIIGETRNSWLGFNGTKKIPKKGGYGICFSEEELNKEAWVHENGHRIADKLRFCKDYEKLQKIYHILNDNA
jgi:hypothetical protein